MIVLIGSQLLHLKLDDITGNSVLDSSGKGNNGQLQGAPQILADETLGGCLSLNGSTQYIDLPPDSIPSGNEITVSFWAYGDENMEQNSALIEAVDKQGKVLLGIALSWKESSITFTCAGDSISQRAQASDFKGAWTFWAFTRNATTGEMAIYRNGVLWHNGKGSTNQITTSTVVRVGVSADGNNYYYGKLAHLRVYSEVLSLAVITHDMEADQTAISSFRRSYPLDFRLHNDDEQEVLEITDDPAGHEMHMEVSNASGQVITLIEPDSTTADASNYHLALRFRPDTLSVVSQTYASYATSTLAAYTTALEKSASQTFQDFVASLPQSARPALSSSATQAFAVDTALTLQDTLHQQGWNIGYQQEPDGTTSIYFLSVQTRSLPPAAKMVITLPHVSANGTGGARGTRVELRYQQLSFGSETIPISGSRQAFLSIVNQRGQETLPLHVGFVGYNTILNDGLPPGNTLTLNITNTLNDSVIALNPQESSAPSKFILSFDVQADNVVKEWALGTTSQVKAIQIAPADTANWSLIPPDTQATIPEWILIPKTNKTALAAQERVQVNLSRIITSLASGQTNLYIKYENIPGYWDGQLITTIEKTPLLKQGNAIGIGALLPANRLTVSAATQHLQLRREANAQSGGNQLYLELYQEDATGSTLPEVHPSIRFNHRANYSQRIEARKNGLHIKTGDLTADTYSDLFAAGGRFNGGVAAGGTTAPDRPLSITGAGAASELISLKDTAGTTKWHINLNAKSPGINIAETGILDGRLFIQPGGNVGINTTQPAARLTVMASNQHMQLRREASETTGNKQLYLELYQDDPTGSTVPTVYPSLRFHHAGSFWERIEARNDGFHLKTGDLNSDAYVDVIAKDGHFQGRMYATTKSFKIDHPLKTNHHLIHACLEGPESGVYYRGEAQLEDGQTTVHLPDYFEALTRSEGRTVQLTCIGKEPFLLSYEEIVDGMFQVYGSKANGTFSWEVKAIRADVDKLEIEVRKEHNA